METNQLQQQLFNYLKEQLPAHLSMVDELMDLLDLSADSVYRRIRGEKPITLAEMKKICGHYHLSIDQLLQLENESVLFSAPGLNGAALSMPDYLRKVLGQLKYFNSFKKPQLLYICKDLPIWDFYLFPALAAFKTFFWAKTINNEPQLRNKQFSMGEFAYPECFAIGQQMHDEQSRIPSTEIWNHETFNSTINQIAFYRDSGTFKSSAELETVILSLHQTMDHLQLQADKGQKFMPGATEVSYKEAIHFYVNDLIIGSNTGILNLDGQKMTMITYSGLSYLITHDKRFSDKSAEFFNTMTGRSTLISKTGERDRNRYFNAIREQVDALRK